MQQKRSIVGLGKCTVAFIGKHFPSIATNTCARIRISRITNVWQVKYIVADGAFYNFAPSNSANRLILRNQEKWIDGFWGLNLWNVRSGVPRPTVSFKTPPTFHVPRFWAHGSGARVGLLVILGRLSGVLAQVTEHLPRGTDHILWGGRVGKVNQGGKKKIVAVVIKGGFGSNSTWDDSQSVL